MGFQACRTSRGALANPYPGRSTRERFSFTRKKLIVCVLPGWELILARFFRFTRVLISEDLPTLDFPAMATSGRFPGGYSEGLAALLTNSAERTFMVFSPGPRSFPSSRPQAGSW